MESRHFLRYFSVLYTGIIIDILIITDLTPELYGTCLSEVFVYTLLFRLSSAGRKGIEDMISLCIFDSSDIRMFFSMKTVNKNFFHLF